MSETLRQTGKELNDHQKRREKQYALTRGVNQLLSAYDFWINTGPYPVHIVYDESQQMLWVEGDNTFSWIDIKSTDFYKAHHKLSSIIEKINNPNAGEREGMAMVSETSQRKAKDIFLAIHEKISNQSRKRPRVVIHKSNKVYKAILRKLYNDTLTQRNKVRNKFVINGEESEVHIIDLSEAGKEYFSRIIADLYHYYYKTKFLGSDREEGVFPINTFTEIRRKLKNRQVLSSEEICQLIEHLIDNEIINAVYYDDLDKGHHAKGLKKFMTNQLWAMLYDEQKYNYYIIESLSQGRSKRQRDKDSELSQRLGIDNNSLFTEGGHKSLASVASKELRRAGIEDMLRSRTWISDANMTSEIIETIFTHQIDQLKKHFEEQGYKVIIDRVEVINKFSGSQGIDVTSNDVQTMQNNLNKANITIGESHTDQELLPRVIDNTYTYKVDNITHIVDAETQQIIKAIISKDMKKTGGNGTYEDIKIRVSYSLKDKTEKVFEETGGYEHMIVNMSSHNECGLSDHNIILDPKKTIVNMIRTKSHVGIDEFTKLVSGGLDTTIKNLLDRKDKLDNDRVSGGEKTFIKTQYPLRNTIPKEIITLANENINDDKKIDESICYTDLDIKPAIKKHIENAIAVYIINNLFDSGMVQWYFYDNDSIDGVNQKIKDELKDKICFSQQGRKELIQKALTSKHQNEYRICGGGSQNLTNALRNGTLSPNATIGIPHNGSIMYIRIPTLAGILSDSMKTPTSSLVQKSVANEILKVLM